LRAAFAAVVIVAVARVAAGAVEDDLRDGDKYFDQGEWKKAAAAYDRAIGKAPGEVSAEAYGKRAAIFIILKDMKGGLEFIEHAKARSSDLANAPALLEQEALILWETGKRDDAIKVAEKVVALRPTTFTNQKIIGEYYSSRDPAKTATAFEQYLAHRPAELEPGDVLPRIRLGFAYLANAHRDVGDGEDPQALALYSKAVDQFELVERKFGKKPNAQVNADNGLCAAYEGLGKWDQATTVCERVTADPARVDPTGSAWYHLAKSYLARTQTKRARVAAGEFAKLRKGEARAQILIGDTYFAERDWTGALDHYLSAEKLLRSNQQRDQIALSIQLGKTYRRLPAPPTGPNTNLDKAIDKLSTAQAANPASLELATELGGAYLDAHQDAKASALADRVLAVPAVASAPADRRAAVLVIAGKAMFNQQKLREARQRFEAAQQLEPKNIQIQRALVETIDEQAFEMMKEPKSAQSLLEQALAVDPQSPATRTDLAILAIDRGDCDAARPELVKLRDTRGADVVLVQRLTARAYLCGAHPDVKAAEQAFAGAEKEAKKANAQLLLAEIYTEWAPLEWDTNLDDAVDKLELAVQIGGQEPELAPAAKRNLALALYRRGWKLLGAGKAPEAASDFERATRDPSVLKGTEPYAFDFSYALALLDTGRAQDAVKLFRSLASRGNQAAYLRGAYAKIGAQFFAAYATYRTATGAARQSACGELARMEPELGARARDLVASCWEAVAYDEWKAGNPGAANRALATADKSANADQKRRIGLDRAALALGKDKLGELESLGGNPPEALVDLGIVYDLIGRPRDAYDAWQRARAKGVVARDLQKWIDAKKRIYGY
jgi:cytochrome c-type biogenesis protein CcmH/NrfG